MSSRCRLCGAEVTFGPHPGNPEKQAPFNPNGEIHFATCTAKKPKNVYPTIGSLPKCKPCISECCDPDAKYIYKKQVEGEPRERIGLRCGQLHLITWIANTPVHLALVNSTEEIVNEARNNRRW